MATVPRVMADQRAAGFALAAAGAALFASKAVVVKLAYQTTNDGGASLAPDPITLLSLRMGFALPVYCAIGVVLWNRRRARALALPGGRHVAAIAVAGALGYYLASFLDFSGLQYITAQLERLILFTYPIVVVALGAIFLGSRITAKMVAAIALSYGGLALVLLTGATRVSENLSLGAGLVAAAAFAFALYQLASKPLMARIGSPLFTCLAMGGAALCVLLHFVLNCLWSPALLEAQLSPRTLELAAILALFCTLLPSFMMTSAIQRIGPQSVAVIGTLSPIATVILAVWLLNEPFGISDAAGAACVMAGVALYNVWDR